MYEAFGLVTRGDTAARRSLARRLGHEHPTVVIDNAETNLAAAAGVAEWTVRAGAAAVIVTSRAPLGLAAEALLRVPPLAGGEGSVLLGQRHAERDAADVAASLPADMITAVLARADGMPLAVELIAIQLASFGALDPVAVGPSDRKPRPGDDAVAAVLASSIDALSASARRAFCRLTHWPAGFDLDTVHYALAELGDPVEIVQELLLHSLVQREQHRYRMFEPVRACGLRHAALDGTTDASERSLIEWCTWFGRQAGPGAAPGSSGDAVVWRARLIDERSNVDAASVFGPPPAASMKQRSSACVPVGISTSSNPAMTT